MVSADTWCLLACCVTDWWPRLQYVATLGRTGQVIQMGLSETPRFRIPLLVPPYCYSICRGCSEYYITGCQTCSGSSTRLPVTPFHLSSNTITQWLLHIQCQEVAAAYDRLQFWCLWGLLRSISGNLTSLERNRNSILLTAPHSAMYPFSSCRFLIL